MVNYYIYAKDFSGSTNEREYYHSNGLKTLEQFKSDVENMKKELLDAGDPPTESKIIYLHWGSHCYEVDEGITRRTYIKLLGMHSATDPGVIIDWLQQKNVTGDENNKIKLLYIITDGLVDERSAAACFDSNKNMHYETVVFHAINENPRQVDLSVAASFFKSRCKVYCNYELTDNIDISEFYDYEKINLDNFSAEKDSLKSYIKLKHINKYQQNVRALHEIEKLRRLRGRLFDELSSKSEKCEVNLETKDRNEFLREFVRTDWYNNLCNSEFNEMKVEVDKSITTLINYIVSDKKSYSFDALRFDTKFHKSVNKEPIVDVNFTAEQEIEFPDIILEDDKGIPVVIITELNLLDKLIFHRKIRTSRPGAVSLASFSKFTSAMDCPLFLMNDPDLSETIGYFYTLNVYKQFLESGIHAEPRTRKWFNGGLVLTDMEEFDKYNDYILSATYFDYKKVNFNVGLFYYVLWKNCEKKEWMDRNVVEQFKKYAMRRIGGTVCKIALSSLPLAPPNNASLLTALWYCVELSSCVFKNDPLIFAHERLRQFYGGVADCMIEILKYFDYDLDLKAIEKRSELMSYVTTLKRIPRRKDKVYHLLEKIFKTVDGFLVSEIEKPFNLYILNYLKLNHKGMLSDDVVEETLHLNDYVHLMYFVGDMEASENGASGVDICEKTYRPYFTIEQNKSFYTDLAKICKQVLIMNDDDKDKVQITYEPIESLEFNRILSLYNLFIYYVKEKERYPTLPDYIEYISKRKKFNGDLVTIFPSNVYFDAKNVHARYQKVVSKVEVSEFIKVCKSHVKRPDRIKAEERVKFNGENEIQEFISTEESKVKLIKRT